MAVFLLVLYFFLLTSAFDFGYLSTKCPYRYNPTQGHPQSVEQDPKCSLVQVNVVYRHGSRTPSLKYIEKFMELQKRLKDVDHPDAKNLVDYVLPFTGDKQLLVTGEEEMQNLGKRMRANTKIDFTTANTEFFSSSLDRSYESGRYFYEGILNSKTGYEDQVEVDDSRLRFFASCKKYIDEIDENPHIEVESERFLKSPKFLELFKDGMKKYQKLTLSTSELSLLDKICGHLIASIEGNVTVLPPPCIFFQDEKLNLALDYSMVLKQFWKKSYPYKINYEQSGPLFGSMLEKMKAAIRDHAKYSRNLKQGVFWFGHAETVIPIITALGLFKPNGNLTYTTFDYWLSKINEAPTSPELFRGAIVSPFAGNVGLYLYYCDTSPPNDYMIEVRVNEKPVYWFDADFNHKPFSTSLRVFEKFKEYLPRNYDNNKVCNGTASFRFSAYVTTISISSVIIVNAIRYCWN